MAHGKLVELKWYNNRDIGGTHMDILMTWFLKSKTHGSRNGLIEWPSRPHLSDTMHHSKTARW